jgi:hypothetical protein
MNNINHLENNYLTLGQLSKRCGINSECILELIAAQCAPPHSYETQTITLIRDAMDNQHVEQITTTRYYHPSTLDWTEREYHIAGKLGAGLLSYFLENRFLIVSKSKKRALTPTPKMSQFLKQSL